MDTARDEELYQDYLDAFYIGDGGDHLMPAIMTRDDQIAQVFNRLSFGSLLELCQLLKVQLDPTDKNQAALLLTRFLMNGEANSYGGD